MRVDNYKSTIRASLEARTLRLRKRSLFLSEEDGLSSGFRRMNKDLRCHFAAADGGRRTFHKKQDFSKPFKNTMMDYSCELSRHLRRPALAGESPCHAPESPIVQITFLGLPPSGAFTTVRGCHTTNTSSIRSSFLAVDCRTTQSAPLSV